MILFLTSSPTGAYRSGAPAPFRGFDPANGLAQELRRNWKEQSRCLLIAAFPDAAAQNEQMRDFFEGVLIDTGLSIECLDLCDGRNGRESVEKLQSYDMIILSGGHVPTEKAFFMEIGLAEKIRGFEGIVMGISAGSMNCARTVYAQPEMPGEATDPSYQRFIPGLGLTDCNILPHYNAVRDDVLDGMRLMEDITYPDSMGRTFYAIVDGSYLFQTQSAGKVRAEIRGEAYRIRDGRIEQISRPGETWDLK
jgi:peptidase E